MAKAGTAYVEVVGDFTKLRRQLAQEMGGRNTLKIDSTFGSKGVTQFERARQKVERETRHSLVQDLDVDYNSAGMSAWEEARDKAIFESKRPIDVELGFEIDRDELARYNATLERIRAEVKHRDRYKVHLGADFDERAFAAMNRETEKTNRNLNQTNRAAHDTGGGMKFLGRALHGATLGMFQFKTRIPLVQLVTMGGLAYNAAGGVTALAGALAPLSGLLGAIGPLATSAAQGIGAIKLATAGVGDAISAAFAEQDKAATDATSSLQAQETAAEGVREAELSLASAHRAARDAQEQLSVARKDATREIEDMRRAVRDLALQEEGASLSLKEAKAAFAELAKTGAGELEIEQASLRIREARAELRKTREEGRRARQDLGAVTQVGGVKGMPQVVAARRSLEDANRGVVEAEREVANAIKQSAVAMDKTSGSADALAAKMAALSPPARRFAKFIIGLRPAVKNLQRVAAQGLLPGVEKGITSAMKQLPRFQRIIAGTSQALGDLAEKAGKNIGKEAFAADIEEQGKRNVVTIRRLGEAGLDLVGAFRHITLAAGPMVDSLTKWVGTLTDAFRQSAQTGRETGKLQKFFKDAGDTFFIVKDILRDLAFSLYNIGRAGRAAFGNELLANIKTGAANLREWTDSVRGQRELVSVFKDIGENLKDAGRFVRDISEDFRRMKAEGKSTGEALNNIFLEVFTAFVANSAEFGAKAAVAFAKGFVQADIWGKLVAGAFLAAKFGPLIGLFRKQGVAGGAAYAEGASLGMTSGIGGKAAAGGAVAGAAGGGIFGKAMTKLAKFGRVGAIGGGLLLGNALMEGVGKRVREGSNDARKALDELARDPKVTDIFKGDAGSFGEAIFGKTDATKNAQEVKKALEVVERGDSKLTLKGLQRLRRLMEDIPDLSDKARGKLDNIFSTIGRLQGRFAEKFNLKFPVDAPLAQIRRLETGMDRLRLHITGSLEDVQRQTKRNMRLIANSMGIESHRGRLAARENFLLAAKDIKNLMDSGVVAGRKGAEEIRKVMVHYLATFGIKGKVAKVLASSYSAKSIERALTGDTRLPGARGGSQTKAHGVQRGGPIDMGAPSGDTVPAMLERGEYVLNRKAVEQVGRPVLDHLNFRRAKRFQSGGIVALGRKLQKEGYEVGEHPAFGGVHPVHVTGSHHYKGEAIDVNDDQAPFASGGGEPGSLDRLYSKLKGMPGVVELLWRVANHFDHLHVAMTGGGKLNLGGLGQAVQAPQLPQLELSGPGGSVHTMAQRAVDVVRAGAQLKLNAAAANASPGVDLLDGAVGVSAGDGNVEKVFADVARQLSTSRVATLALGEAGFTESGMRDLSYGDASSQGALQLLASTASGLGVSPHDEAAIASLFFTRGFYGKGGANALAAQGLPAHLVAQGVQGSATSDGSNYLAQESKARGWMKRFKLAKGGLVAMVGDSLGLGTQGPLKARLKGKLRADNKVSRRSPTGLGVLKDKFRGDDFIKYVFDLGTNDDSAAMLAGSVQGADKATGRRPLVVPTLNGADADAKNKKLRALAGGDIHLVEWAKRSKGLLTDDGIHATGAGYSKRAAMIAGVLSQLRADEKDPKLPKLTGTLKHKTRQTVKALAHTKDKKRRAKILARFSKKLKKYGLPTKLLNEIDFLGLAHDRYSSFADSAAGGDVTNDDDTVTKGLIQGKNEGDWLAADLTAMFSMRNKLIKAKNIVTANEKKVSDSFKWVSEQLKGFSKDGKAPRGWQGVNPVTDSIEKWNKQSHGKRIKRMKEFRDKHGKLPGDRDFNTHTGKLSEVPKSRLSALKTTKNELKKQRTLLQGAISTDEAAVDSIPTQLQGLQGFGPDKILKSPWPRGTIYGGDILAAQDRILELFKVPPATTDDTTDSESTELLRQLLREANLRTNVAERQFDILRNFPPFGGQFATGGTVPGPTGAPRTVIAHGGETITPAGQGTAAPNVYVNIDGKVSWLKDFVTTQVQAETRTMAKGRALPGRGGGR